MQWLQMYMYHIFQTPVMRNHNGPVKYYRKHMEPDFVCCIFMVDFHWTLWWMMLLRSPDINFKHLPWPARYCNNWLVIKCRQMLVYTRKHKHFVQDPHSTNILFEKCTQTGSLLNLICMKTCLMLDEMMNAFVTRKNQLAHTPQNKQTNKIRTT